MGRAACPMIVAVWVNGHNGRAFGEELLGNRMQERTPMAASKHGRLPNEGIDNHSSIGKMRQVRLRPGSCGIGLHVGEGTPIMLHDPLPHQGFIEVFSDQINLLLGITPPAQHLRSSKPASNHRQVGTGEGPEIIC
jgi:hypothetical protein